MAEETYAYETTQNSEELFKLRKSELKVLRKKAIKDKKSRLFNNKEHRSIRDDKIDRIALKIKTIKSKIAIYNRFGKVEKGRTNILGDIKSLIENDIDLIEEIQRDESIKESDSDKPVVLGIESEEYEKDEPVTIEDLELEAYKPEVDEAHLNE